MKAPAVASFSAARARGGVLVLAGLAAAIFLGWPSFSINQGSDWRKVLAGFQLQRETGAFIGTTRSLIHFHGLEGGSGVVRFTLAPRIKGDRVEVDLLGPSGRQALRIEGQSVEVQAPFANSQGLELNLETKLSTNPRPLLLSRLRVDRELTPTRVLLSLIPMFLGGFVALLLWRQEAGVRIAAKAVFVTAAAAVFTLTAWDPVRALSLPGAVREWMPLTLGLGFAVIGLSRERWSAAIALTGVTLSLHILTVHSGFVYDDRLWARPWTLSELASTLWGSEDPRGISGQHYRPLPSFSHALDHALWGPSTFAFHSTNMALHTASGLVLMALLERLGLSRKPAFLGALTLVLHPLAASSVGWISERTDTLADIFILTTLLVFLGDRGMRAKRVLGLALMALWSKETAVMLPALAALLAVVGLGHEERKARFAMWRALLGLVVLYVTIWVSLFPEKTVGRVQATAAALQSEQSGWLALFGSLYSQLLHPIGFETWRATRGGPGPELWVGFAALIAVGALAASFLDSPRARAWRVVAAGMVFPALVVIPFRGHDAVDVYRLGHTPALGFGMVVAGLAAVLARESFWRAAALAALLLVRFGPLASDTSSAWGYPGFQFRMALRFNLENPLFLSGLDPEMRQDLERESRFESHRDDPLGNPFVP